MYRNYFKFILTLVIGLTLFSAGNVMAGQQNKFAGNATFGAFNEPSIATEKYSYNNGETVVIYGSGYRKFEQVNIVIDSYNNALGQSEVSSQWTVFADYRGQFITQVGFDSLRSASGTFNIKAASLTGKSVAETNIIASPQAIGVDIEQCANGPRSAPIPCNISSGNDGYTRGNLVKSKSHYVEGDSVPIRVIATGLTVGTTYTVTIGYDYTKGGKYAIDYLTSYNRTESVNNNPCVGVTGLTCTLDANGNPIPTDTEPIAQDPANTAKGVTQESGVFSIFGGTITSVSPYSSSGSITGDSSKFLTITFVATSESVVIAYGAHIATRLDFGVGNSAISVSGSPYHNFVSAFPGANSGNRDLQFGATAVLFPALVTIIKDAVPNFGTDFSFTISGPAGITPNSTFTLDDDDDPTLSNTQIISGVTSFGAGNEITVTEANTPGWMLTNISCVESNGGLGTTADSTTSVGNRNATIRTQEGEAITCTFTNEIVLAAGASIDGVITDSLGSGL
ncbi:MAG: hypothetical protein ABIP06_02600, partial [Pyrinomonadaceae bacterium]